MKPLRHSDIWSLALGLCKNKMIMTIHAKIKTVFAAYSKFAEIYARCFESLNIWGHLNDVF